MLVGADSRQVEPDVERSWLAGFDSGRRATTVHDAPTVRSVAFCDGGEPYVLTAVDCIGLPRLPGPHGRHVVAATHTHHAPDTLGLWGPEQTVSGVDQDFLARLRAAVSDSAAAARQSLTSARLRAGSVAVPELVANTRTPGLVDDELSVVQAVADDGSVVATLLGYACHPEVLASDATDVTADYPGHLCRFVEEAHGGTAVFVAGALGGMLSPATEIRTHAEAERYGRVLADAAEVAWGELFDAEVAFARASLPVTLTNPNYRAALAIGLVSPVEWQDDRVVTEVSLARLGPVMLAGVPGELLPKLGLQLKEWLRAAGATVPFVVGLADDELGYLLPEEDFVTPVDWDDPGAQYEESMSPSSRCGTEVMAGLRGLLAQV